MLGTPIQVDRIYSSTYRMVIKAYTRLLSQPTLQTSGVSVFMDIPLPTVLVVSVTQATTPLFAASPAVLIRTVAIDTPIYAEPGIVPPAVHQQADTLQVLPPEPLADTTILAQSAVPTPALPSHTAMLPMPT